MCGRYWIDPYDDEPATEKLARMIAERYGEPMPAGEIYPSMPVAALKVGTKKKADVKLLRWGISVPNVQRIVINARSETVFQKPSFARHIETRRCVLPASGFFEWSHGSEKTRWLFRLPEKGVMYLAGLFDEYDCCAILTAEANASVRGVHSRMPVILRAGEVNGFLTDIDAARKKLSMEQPELLAANGTDQADAL